MGPVLDNTPVAMPSRIQGDWLRTTAVDMLGRAFTLGDVYVKAYIAGRSPNLEICEVTRLDGGKIYGNGSHVNVKYPGRCLIVPKEYGTS